MQKYTPEYTDLSVRFMAARTVANHGAFFTPHLREGMSLLDCGCGPGTITLGLAELVAPGAVTGVDAEPTQVTIARRAAIETHAQNVEFQIADANKLPFADGMFDGVFSHALLEHLADPVGALREFRRVLKPGSVAGVCSPDWGGFVIAPTSSEVEAALASYMDVRRSNGGDPRAGRMLGGYMSEAGFTSISMSARYECYQDRDRIAEYLAHILDMTPDEDHEPNRAAKTLRTWAQSPYGLFAHCWVSAIGLA
jgi:ubiquinone/menaquinone biosynthesis C-methylase UbiE